VPPPPQSPKSVLTPVSNPAREQAQEQFRQYLRQADKFIKDKNFDLAKKELQEAKNLDPSNPFIVAFEERITMFEKGLPPKVAPLIPPKIEPKAPPPPESKQPEPDAPAAPEVQPEHQKAALERKIRESVEEEYKVRFTKELKRAEEHAAKILEEERMKIEAQRHALKIKHDQQLDEARQRAENEYQAKLAADVSRSEERLKDQYESKLRLMEEELKAQLSLTHATEIRELEGRLRREHDALLERERAAFQENERALQEKFDRERQDSASSSQALAREQAHLLQEEQEKLRKQMNDELQAALQAEREASRAEFEALKKKVEESYHAEQEKLTGEHRRQLEEELQTMRHREKEEFERKNASMRQNIEQELRAAFEEQLEQERRRLQKESDAAVENEKKRLHDEYSGQMEEQEEKIKAMRAGLQREMESTFLKRMEQIADQYDYKMELLGAKIPDSVDEKKELYRARMREVYGDGMPTVEGAKNIMALKELLELTFDDHLALEADVRLDLYVEHVERLILANELDIKGSDTLEKLKQQYRISGEESARLEPYILSSLQRLAVKGRILVADDELLLLQSLDNLLTDSGFQVLPAESVEKALEILGSTSVDLILSDIKFKENDMDGFQFFLNIQTQPQLRKIPFVFMSSLKDGIIIRSGIQLGADDYLTKPVEPDLLLAVVEGKLKRFRTFQGN